MSDPVTALLAMDFQVGIVGRLGDSTVVEAAARAVAAARDAGIPVLFVRVAFRPGLPEISPNNRQFGALRQGPSDVAAAMGQDHPATQLHAALEPRADEPVIVKRRVSAFSGSDLDVLLRGAGATRLVLAGVSTSGVVLSTLRQAADLDFACTVLSDACADGDPEVHRVLTEKVFPRQAVVTTVDEWTESLV